jgi:DNA repair protein RadC
MGVGSQNQDACAEMQANCSPILPAEKAPAEKASAENSAKPSPGQTDLDVARSNLLAVGPSVVSDDELLALWLGLSDIRAAAQLRQGQDGICTLLRAPAGRLMAAPGLGRVRTGRLLAAVALVERAAESGLRAMPELSSSSAVRRFLRLKLSHQPREIFACLFLDNRHRLICFEPLFFGTVDRASIHPREVLRRALEVNAAAVILAHNHPSGVAEPSGSDLALTEDLSDLLRRIDVRVLDHWVIGRGSEVSFAERGFIR